MRVTGRLFLNYKTHYLLFVARLGVSNIDAELQQSLRADSVAVIVNFGSKLGSDNWMI
jgi:hypothetical protein